MAFAPSVAPGTLRGDCSLTPADPTSWAPKEATKVSALRIWTQPVIRACQACCFVSLVFSFLSELVTLREGLGLIEVYRICISVVS